MGDIRLAPEPYSAAITVTIMTMTFLITILILGPIESWMRSHLRHVQCTPSAVTVAHLYTEWGRFLMCQCHVGLGGGGGSRGSRSKLKATELRVLNCSPHRDFPSVAF